MPAATTRDLALLVKGPSSIGWIVVHSAEGHERGLVVFLILGGANLPHITNPPSVHRQSHRSPGGVQARPP